MGEQLIDLFAISLPLLLLLLAWFTGRWVDRSHLRSIEEREGQFSYMLVTDIKSFPGDVIAEKRGEMVLGQVVVATDYLKTFLAKLRNIFGGEVRSYEMLLQRARREALLRMMAQANRKGYNAVCNVRYHTSDIGGMTSSKGSAMVEVLTSGTAYTIRREAST